MKRIAIIITSIIIIVTQSGCASSPNRAAEGSVIGGLVGATTGAIIGNQGHDRNQDRTRGALIGGAIGAIGGALVGSQIQKQPSQQQAVSPAQQTANPNQIPLSQVVEWARQGVHEDVIIDRIRLSNSRYTLSEADVNYLKSNGVSGKVLMQMQGF